MRARVHVTPSARKDIESGEIYYDRIRKGLGWAFVDVVLDALDSLSLLPLGYGEVEHGVRAIATSRFQHVVYYRTDGTTVDVLAVLHGRRNAKFSPN